jgi:1-acyl-sn-glycerol-3-phosphate acyltransferase
MRDLADRAMTGLARLLVRIFFRSIELDGGERLPAAGPVVLVANHSNGLVDGLLLMATLQRYPRFLGKSTLFRIPPLWPFLKLGGVIPVYRTVDAVPGDHNVSAFATSHRLLREGAMVAVFPEGISHDELSLQPLKTGAARIALDAANDGAAGLVTVAVGLVYDAKARFRSRALVRVGDPVRVDGRSGRDRDDGPADERAAVRALTGDLAAQLSRVTPTFASWTQAEELPRIAEVLVRTPGVGLAVDVGLGAQVHVAARLAVLEQAFPGALHQLRADYATYRRGLDLIGVNDAQLTAGPRRRRLTVAWAAAKVVVAVPFAVVGVLVHVVSFQVVKAAAKRPTNEGIRATVKLLGCFVLFAVTYTVVGVIVGRAFGPWAGLLAAAGAPICGLLAVRALGRVQRIGGFVEGLRVVRAQRDMLESVLAQRAAVVRDARVLLAGA